MRNPDVWKERRVLPLAVHDSKEAFVPWKTNGALLWLTNLMEFH